MSTITSLKLGTVPITEEGVERYKFSDTITNHFTQIFEYTEDLNCSVGRIFSKVKIPVSWFTVMNANYMIATMDINNPSGSTLNIKGWIDAIDLLSDSEDYPMVEVRWHFDYFEMFKSSATLGYGHIKRRPYDDLDSTPIQNYPIRFKKFNKKEYDLGQKVKTTSTPPEDIWWVIVSFNHSSGGNTSIEYRTIPVIFSGSIRYIKFKEAGTDKITLVPTIAQIYAGKLDEIYGIDPQNLNGAWLSPVPPFTVEGCSGTGNTSTDPIVLQTNTLGYATGEVATGQNAYGWLTGVGRSVAYTQMSLSPKLVSSEEIEYAVISSDGIKALELPYGFEVSTLDCTLYIEPDGPYVEFTFKDGSYGNLEGLAVNIPLSTIPVNSNAFSSYIYSGQREFDKEARVIASNANAWKSAASGAGSGAMMGAFGAQGAAVGMLGGAFSGLISYGVEMGYQNDEEQRILDRLKAQQPSSLIISSNSILPIFRHYGFTLCSIVPDDYSLAQISNTRSNFGISVDEILSSCETQVKTTSPTGYYVIKNLIISGSIPKEAKDYIKKKFDAGVRLL